MFLLWQCFEAQISLSLSQMLSSAGNAIPDSKAFLCSSNFTFTWQPAAGSTCTKLSMSAHFANHKAQFFRHNSRNECLTRESESDITHKRGKMDSTNPVFAPRRAVFRSNWAIIRNIEQLFGRRKNCDDCVASSHTWWLLVMDQYDANKVSLWTIWF